MTRWEEPIEWRKIPHLPQRYEVSNTGVVRVLPREVTVYRKNGNESVRQIDGRYLTPYTRATGKSKGHPVVSLSATADDPVKIGEIRVCQLVARAFHGVPYEPGDMHGAQKWRIRHKDGDILNVSADNLEWIGNNGPGDVESGELYAQNLRRLAELRDEPVEDWIRRIWGDDYETDAA